MTIVPHRLRIAVLGLAVTALAALPSATAAAGAPVAEETGSTSGDQATGPQWLARLCERRFDQAVETYQATFPDRDLDTLGELLHEEITVILANGTVVLGREQAIESLTPFFADPTWTQTFVEVTRSVQRCRSAFVLFDSVLSFPSGFTQHTLIGLTFTFHHGQWLILHDQLTLLPD